MDVNFNRTLYLNDEKNLTDLFMEILPEFPFERFAGRNFSESEILKNFTRMRNQLNKILNSKALDDYVLYWLLFAYISLILFGAIGNGLVCFVVVRKPSMRTPRNLFIINLAISDLLLCIITMPFSLIEISFKLWPLGKVTCKLVAALQATSIFVSTISITAIALDRYKVIVNPKPERCHPLRSVATIGFIWTTAMALSSPLMLFRTVETLTIKTPISVSLDYCIEKWPIEHGRALYSIATILGQYILPVVTVTIAYVLILRKLKRRLLEKERSTQLKEKQRLEKLKNQKTKLLLISISFIFCISWLPLNIVNIVADLFYPFDDSQAYRVLFACCHLLGMSSACSNPILYGYFNDNFRKEFVEIFSKCCPCFSFRRWLSNNRRPSEAIELSAPNNNTAVLERH